MRRDQAVLKNLPPAVDIEMGVEIDDCVVQVVSAAVGSRRLSVQPIDDLCKRFHTNLPFHLLKDLNSPWQRREASQEKG